MNIGHPGAYIYKYPISHMLCAHWIDMILKFSLTT